MATRIRMLRGTSTAWTEEDPILDAGEQGYELDTRRYKIGDGHSRWLQLDYYIPAADIMVMIEEALVDVGAGEGAISAIELNAALEAHINSTSPHPVYDDGPSFLLAYQNAKV